MKIGRFFGMALGITAALGFGVLATGGIQQAEAQVSNVCPNTLALSNSGQCDTEFVLNANGTLSTLANSTLPYDGADDQLVGVINNDPNFVIGGITLTGPSDLFGFDGDGICTYGPLNPFGNAVATPSGSLGYCTQDQSNGDESTVVGNDYQGPDNSSPNGFNTIDAGLDTGTVTFTNPLTNGQTTFFSLELSPAAGGLGGGVIAPTPEPGTLLLLGPMGLALLPMLRRRRVQK